jgi:hypothetical protein
MTNKKGNNERFLQDFEATDFGIPGIIFLIFMFLFSLLSSALFRLLGFRSGRISSGFSYVCMYSTVQYKHKYVPDLMICESFALVITNTTVCNLRRSYEFTVSMSRAGGFVRVTLSYSGQATYSVKFLALCLAHHTTENPKTTVTVTYEALDFHRLSNTKGA